MKNRMKKEFVNFEGGLFSQVEKADVVLEKQRIRIFFDGLG